MWSSVLNKVLKPGTVAISSANGNFQHELDSLGGYSPDSGLARACVLDLAPPLYDPTNRAMIYDRSGKSNHGTITGATWERLPSGLWVQSFDGINNKVDCGSGTSLRIQVLSLFGWISAPSTGTMTIAGNGNVGTGRDGYYLIIAAPDIRAICGDAAGYDVDIETYVGSATTWTFVVAIVGASFLTIYQNAVVGTPTARTKTMTWANPFRLGINPAGATYPLTGKLCMWRMTSTELTSSQITGIYNQERHLFGV